MTSYLDLLNNNNKKKKRCRNSLFTAQTYNKQFVSSKSHMHTYTTLVWKKKKQ